MRFRAILNRDGGTLRTTDLDAFSDRMRDAIVSSGHFLDIHIVEGADIEKALKDAAGDPAVDAIIAGGGDGTISAAAACLMDTDKALAILPAGTMNLFARSLGIPLDLDRAATTFASAEIRKVDVATANGKPFVHQYSVGMHAKLVKLREKMDFASRLGKIRASVKAAFDTLLNPPSMDVALDMGGATLNARTSGLGVTNNLFGEGHLPYADDPAGGVLGIYITTAQRRRHLVWFFLNMLIGRWRDNPQVEIHETDEVTIEFSRVHARHRCVIDGELAELERRTTIRIHQKALTVLVPPPDTTG